FEKSAFFPFAVLVDPVVLAFPAQYPQNVLSKVGSIRPAFSLFTRKFKGILSVVPIKAVPSSAVPALPSSPHPEEEAVSHEARPFASEVSTLFAPGVPPV